ncbi:MAG: prepilin peptidase [Lachnospiraceae bacterium]|nr:prepilin peptidase [Lachnospiraceae bacterium]
MQTVFLLHLTGVAVLWDLKYRKIPNGLIAAGLLCGLWQQVYESGSAGAGVYFSGILLPIVFPGILYYFRMIGAGDIKLLCVIGGYLGPKQVLWCIVYTFLFGGVISAVLIIKRKNLFKRFFYFKTYLSQFLETKQWRPYRIPGDEDGSFCFTIPVFFGVVCVLGGAG